MSNPFIRSQLVLGEEGLKKIANARVAVFGVGGVGGYVIEALARCGIGEIDIIDNDTVAESNINRQIIATHSTIGEYKVDVMEKESKTFHQIRSCINIQHSIFQKTGIHLILQTMTILLMLSILLLPRSI